MNWRWIVAMGLAVIIHWICKPRPRKDIILTQEELEGSTTAVHPAVYTPGRFPGEWDSKTDE